MPFKPGLIEKISQGEYPDNYLDLSSQGITDDEVVQLVSALQACSQMVSLNLSGNLVTDVGAEILSSSQHIESLDLSQNAITSRGFLVLLRNPKLQKLSLFNNRINFTEISHLPLNQTLRELSLSYISIEPVRAVSACFFIKGEPCSTTFDSNETCIPFLQSILDSTGNKHAIFDALPTGKEDEVERGQVNAKLSTTSGSFGSFDWDSLNEKELEELERDMELGGMLPKELVSGKSPTADALVQEGGNERPPSIDPTLASQYATSTEELSRQMKRGEVAPIVNHGTPNSPETSEPPPAPIRWAAKGGKSSANLEEMSPKLRRSSRINKKKRD